MIRAAIQLSKRLLLLLLIASVFACGACRTEDYLFPIKENGKWGYIDSHGKKIIECQFDMAKEFSEGMAAIKIDTLYGFIDIKGKIAIKPQFIDVKKFSDGLCSVRFRKGKILENAFLKNNGEIAFVTNLDVDAFNCGLAKVKIDDEVCYLNKTGEIAIRTHFPHGSSFSENIAVVWAGDSSKYIDTNGRTIRYFKEMNANDFSEGAAIVQEDGTNFYIDKSGKIKINLQRQDLTYFDFSNGMAQVTIAGENHKSGFINTKGEIVISIQYSLIFDFKEERAAYKENGKWGFINKQGEIVIIPKFNDINYKGFKNGLCLVTQGSDWGYINLAGNWVWIGK